MALTNDEIMAKNFKDFFTLIRPYLNASQAFSGYTPVGSIIAVMGVTAPENYLACEGQVVNISAYPDLATYFEQQFGTKNHFGGDGTTTFGIPDLRGEFLRGTGTNSYTNQGSGANVGVHQDATETIGLYHDSATSANWLLSGNPTGVFPKNADFEKVTGTKYMKISSSVSDYADAGSVTYRPTNTSVLYCIAVRNIYLGGSSGGSGTGGHEIQENGTALPTEPALNFNDFDLDDNTTNESTDVQPHRLTSAELDDIVTRPPAVYRGNEYSESEQVVGHWIDGKPIYQKAFPVSETFAKNTVNVVDSVVVNNSETLVKTFLISTDGSAGSHYMAYPLIAGFTNQDKLRLELGEQLGNVIYIVLQYTKTTD